MNRAPVSGRDTLSTDEDTTGSVAVLTNDSDPDGDPLRVSEATQGAHGTVDCTEAGVCTYDPDDHFNGTDFFEYTVRDGRGGSATGAVAVAVRPVNDVPGAKDGGATIAEDAPDFQVDLGALVADVETADLNMAYAVVLRPQKGSLTGSGPTLLYDVTADANGADSFHFRVTDRGDPDGCTPPGPACSAPTQSDTKVFRITITEVNDPPEAADDEARLAEDGTAVLDLAANDKPGPANEGGQELSVSRLNAPAHGTATVIASGPDAGKVRYAPEPDYNGPDSFSYDVCDNGTTNGASNPRCDVASVTLSVAEVNDGVTAAPDRRSTTEDGTLRFPAAELVANDSPGPANESAQKLTVTAVSPTPSTHGTVVLSAGNVVYTPALDFNGEAAFAYTVVDNGTTGGASDPKSATGTVTVAVAAVNDSPIARADAQTVAKNGVLVFDPTANDAPGPTNEAGQSLAVSGVSSPLHGTAEVISSGPDAGKVRYSPQTGYEGEDSFTYEVCDNGSPRACASARVDVTVRADNDPPVLRADEATVAEDGSRAIDVLANDSPGGADEVGQSLLVDAITTAPLHGTAEVVASGADAGRIRYAPGANYNGPDSFRYQACDDGEPTLCATATASVTVTEVNDAPTAVPDERGPVREEESLSFSAAALAASDSAGPANEGGQTLTVTAVAQTAETHGTVALANGEITFTPAPDYNGPARFSYTVRDNGTTNGAADAKSSAGSVAVTVTEVNDAPTALDDVEAVAEDGAFVFDPAANDSAGPANERGQTLTLDSITGPASYGSAVVTGGRLRYVPPTGYAGPDWVDYRVCDDGTTAGGPDRRCTTASVRLKVAPVTASVETAPLPNDSDAGDDPAIWVDRTEPENSTVIGTDKQGGIAVYDLQGNELQNRADGHINNVDLRQGFALGGSAVTLVVASRSSDKNLLFYRVNAVTRKLEGPLETTPSAVVTPWEPYGVCLYRSPANGALYAFVTRRLAGETPAGETDIQQWRLSDAGSGRVGAEVVRSFRVGSQSEGCAADDERGDLYVAEEDVGIWKYGAEPGAGTDPARDRTLVDSTGANGRLRADVEGLAIAYGDDGSGYLFASSQGDSSFVVYRREGGNEYVRTFAVKAGAAIDGTNDTDGIDVTTAALGPAFPNGLFVAHDGRNHAADGTTLLNQNFKLVALDAVLGTGTPPAVPPRPTSCARAYSDTGPWNTPVGPAPAYDPESAFHVSALAGALTSDASQFTYPVYEVSAATPRRTVTLSASGWFSNVTNDGQTLENQRAGTVELPIPPGAEPAAGGDAQIVLVDPSTGDEWGASSLERDPVTGEWTAWNAYHYNTRWSGAAPHDASGRPFFARGAGIPYLAGLIRPCEIARGRIEHALAFAYDYPTAEWVYPATKSDGRAWDGDEDDLDSHPGDMPEGARLQLDPSLTVDGIQAWGCTGVCLTVARALQEYGMYIVDNSGRPKVYFEYEATAGWNGAVQDDTVRKIPLSAFKLLELPPAAP